MKKQTFVGSVTLTATTLSAAKKQFDKSHSDIKAVDGPNWKPSSLLNWTEQTPERQTYAQLKWSPEDVQTIRPNWSLNRCEDELAKIQKHLQDALCQKGYDVMSDLLPSK
jgi:hypothetical protein